MASPKLEPKEKKINEIRRLNGHSSIKGSEYEEMPDRDKINNKTKHELGFDCYDENITLPDGQTIHDIVLLEKTYSNVERFFGISFEDNKSFLHELSCIDYEIGKTIYNYEIKSTKKDLEEFDNDVLEQLDIIENIPYIKNVYSTSKYLEGTGDDGHFYSGCYIDIKEKYKDWEEYCIFVDSIKDFIYIFIPDFGKLNGDKKFEWLEKLSENYIAKDVAEYIQDYHLNQHIQAKIDKLTNLQLPNLTDTKTIEKFVKLYIKQKSLN